MSRRTIVSLAVFLGLSACSLARAADFVTTDESGHGPFVVTNPIPSWGYLDVASEDFSHRERWRGDVETGSGHLGRTIVPTFAARWFSVSPLQGSFAFACSHTPTGPTYAPCQGQSPAPVYISSDGNNPTHLMWTPAAVIVGYYPQCPIASGYSVIHYCTGTHTPYDYTGQPTDFPTFVIGDGIVKPGLPYGSPLKLVVSGATGVPVDCWAEPDEYGLSGPWGMAVYTCP
jgi:hypothetical protein